MTTHTSDLSELTGELCGADSRDAAPVAPAHPFKPTAGPVNTNVTE